MSSEAEDKKPIDLEFIEADNEVMMATYKSEGSLDPVRMYLLNRERQLIAEVKRLREENTRLKEIVDDEFGPPDDPEEEKQERIRDYIYRNGNYTTRSRRLS